jgi:hypothetical protein
MTAPADMSTGVTIDPATGVLSFNAKAVAEGAAPVNKWGKWAVPVTIVDSAGAPSTVTKYVNVSLDDGNGSSNNSLWFSVFSFNIGVAATLAPYFESREVPSYNQFVVPRQTLLYASPPYGQPSTNTALLVDQILSSDGVLFTYTPPAVGSLGPNMPAVAATLGATEWSITSNSGKSGSSLLLPNGVTFSGSGETATLSVNFDPVNGGADYSIGNTAGNKTGIYNFLVTAKDSNNFVQSFPVSINIAAPPPRSALTSLGATSSVPPPDRQASYANGAVLRYGHTSACDIISLTNTNANAGLCTWSITVIQGDSDAGVTPPTLSSVDLNHAVSSGNNILNIGPNVMAGPFSFLVTCLDQQNVSQTIFFTVVYE